jgi:hypothetical protein
MCAGTINLWNDEESITDLLDNRKLSFLYPDIARRLLEHATKVDIARFSPLIENPVCVKRFMGSKLSLDFGSDQVFDLKTAMEPYTIATMKCAFHPSEQNLHHEQDSKHLYNVLRASAGAYVSNVPTACPSRSNISRRLSPKRNDRSATKLWPQIWAVSRRT